jgi:site-specific recombinase XerD
MPESALRFVPEATTGPVYGVSERSVRRHLAEASAAMGVRLSPHCLRHGWAAAADDAGASVRQIQAQLGHVKVETTERYLKLRPKGVEAIVDAVARAAL